MFTLATNSLFKLVKQFLVYFASNLFGFSAAKENFLISRVPSILMFDMKTLRFFHGDDDDNIGDKRHHDHGQLDQWSLL